MMHDAYKNVQGHQRPKACVVFFHEMLEESDSGRLRFYSWPHYSIVFSL